MSRFASAAVIALAVSAGSLGLSARQSSANDCCCPPPPVKVTLCVDDPCDCCPGQEVCVCVPACCTETPTVCWRDGLFGRRIATYTWKCCCYSLDVVLTKHGKVIVRD